jgi:hypothetical protein
VIGVQALPLVHAFSQSDRPEERAIFVRVCLDLIAGRARRGDLLPEDWRQALQACLERAGAAERESYVAGLAKAYAKAGREPPEPVEGRFALSSRDDIEAILRQGRPDRIVALAADRKARLRPEHFEALVPRAREWAEGGDRRLVDALLSRDLIRLEAAPLFLEATPAQRAAILLAAQRDALGRKAPATALDEETAGRLEFAAIAGQDREFAEALGAALGADPALAQRIAADPAGEPLAVALIALGAPRDIAVRIVTGRDMQESAGYPRIHALARLHDRLSQAAARSIVAALVGRPAASRQPPPRAASREIANPSPFLGRERPARAPIPETAAPPARYSRRP